MRLPYLFVHRLFLHSFLFPLTCNVCDLIVYGYTILAFLSPHFGSMLSHICCIGTVSYAGYVDNIFPTYLWFNVNTTRRSPLTTYNFKPSGFQVRINIPVSIVVGGFCNLIVTGINSKDFQVRFQVNASFLARWRSHFPLLQVFFRGTFDQTFNHSLLDLN